VLYHTIGKIARMFLENHELLVELTKREIKQRYKQSLLGYAWVILNPLMQMIVLAFIFSRILPVGDLSAPYPIFLYLGLLPWTFFSSSLTASTISLILNGKLLSKIYLPRTVFVQSTILAKGVDFILASSLFIVFALFFHVSLTFSSLWFFPLFLIQMWFTYSLSLLVAALNLFYRDIQYLLSFVLMVWMYATPIIYPQSLFGDELQWVFHINPMANFVMLYRQVVLEGTAPDWTLVGYALLITVVTYWIGLRVFKKLEGRFADVI
jgi:lipopolysaccharide transport system permease protein